MAKVPRISDAEWRVMQMLWEKSPATAGDVAQRLADDTAWSPKTVQTLLNRLVAKRAVDYEKKGRTHHYFPLLRESQCLRAASRSFLDRVFSGSVGPMLARFLEEADLSQPEIDELKAILKRKER